MQRTYLLALLTILLFSCKKKDGGLTKNNITGRHEFQGHVTGAIISGDGYLVVCGSNDQNHAMVTKMSFDGNITWTKDYYDNSITKPATITEASNGRYLIVSTTSVNTYGRQFQVSLIDKDGSVLWSQTYGDTKSQTAKKIIRTYNDNYIIAGICNDGNNSVYGGLSLLKINGTGDILWSKEENIDVNKVLYSVIETSDHSYVLTMCNVDTLTDDQSMLLSKLDENGDKVWDSELPVQGGSREARKTIELSSGELMSCGTEYIGQTGTHFIMRTSSTGQVITNNTFGSPNGNLSDIVANDDNGFTAVGTISANNVYRPYLFSIGTDGNKRWEKEFTSSSMQEPPILFKQAGGGYLFVGNVLDKGYYYITGTDENGDL